MNNTYMEALLEKLNKYKSPKKYNKIELNEFFNKLLPKIFMVNNFILKENNGKYDEEYVIKTFGSFSAFEDYENHIHIAEIIDCSVLQTLKFGLIMKELLKYKLKEQFPNKKFIIVLACDGKDKWNTVLRFHQYRKNDKCLYFGANLENFNLGICVEKI